MKTIPQYLFFLLTLTLALQGFAQKGYIKRADRLMSYFRFEDATALYRKEILADTNDLPAREKLAVAYLMAGNTDSAESTYKRLLKNPLARPINWFYYGQVLRMNNKYEMADTAYKKFGAATPNDPLAKEFANFGEDVKPLSIDLKTYELGTTPVNSPASEIGPMYYKNKLLFASNRDQHLPVHMVDWWSGNGFYDLYEEKDFVGTDTLNPATKMTGELNGYLNEGPATFSRDGREMIFTKTNSKRKGDDGILKLGLYHAEFDSAKNCWGNVTPLTLNSSTYDVAHPSLSKDGNRLYFISDMPASIGGTDIYVSEKRGNTWDTPVNLGPGVNTAGMEMFPFIAEDGTLYFSSDSRMGLGGLDIYSARLMKDGKWGEAHNPGTPVNSRADDFGYVAEEKGKHGYLVSNRSGGKGGDDIYRFTRLAGQGFGTVTDAATGKPVENAIISVVSDKGDDRIVKTNANGEFTFVVTTGRVYKIEVKKDPYNSYRKRISAEDVKNGKLEIVLRPMDEKDFDLSKKFKKLVAVVEDLGFKPTQPIQPDTGIEVRPDDLAFELHSVYFDRGSAKIDTLSEVELNKVAQVMTSFPNLVVELGAHTDSRGDASQNMLLSSQRAQSCVDYLVSKGVDRNRLIAIGYGEEYIRNKCVDGVECTEAEHAINRRTEFKVIKFD